MDHQYKQEKKQKRDALAALNAPQPGPAEDLMDVEAHAVTDVSITTQSEPSIPD